jgi:glucokinase
MPTNDGDGAVWKKAVAATMNELRKKLNGATVVGISAPGLPDKENTTIAFMPGRLEGLENFIWKDFLKCPTYVLNDGVAALVAKPGQVRQKIVLMQ